MYSWDVTWSSVSFYYFHSIHIPCRFGYLDIPKQWIQTVKNAPPVTKSKNNKRQELDISTFSVKYVDSMVYSLIGKPFKPAHNENV